MQQLFPSARLLRWDADTSSAKGSEEVILSHFRQHNADILIGTQMLAKGLDLPLVTLVGWFWQMWDSIFRITAQPNAPSNFLPR